MCRCLEGCILCILRLVRRCIWHLVGRCIWPLIGPCIDVLCAGGGTSVEFGDNEPNLVVPEGYLGLCIDICCIGCWVAWYFYCNICRCIDGCLGQGFARCLGWLLRSCAWMWSLWWVFQPLWHHDAVCLAGAPGDSSMGWLLLRSLCWCLCWSLWSYFWAHRRRYLHWCKKRMEYYKMPLQV